MDSARADVESWSSADVCHITQDIFASPTQSFRQLISEFLRESCALTSAKQHYCTRPHDIGFAALLFCPVSSQADLVRASTWHCKLGRLLGHACVESLREHCAVLCAFECLKSRVEPVDCLHAAPLHLQTEENDMQTPLPELMTAFVAPTSSVRF
jgi:hypothetical protein